MRIVVRSRASWCQPLAGNGLFSYGSQPAHRAWRGWLASLTLHVVLIAVTPRITAWLNTPRGRLEAYSVGPLRLRIPERLYFAANAKPPQPPPIRRAAKMPLRATSRGGVALPAPAAAERPKVFIAPAVLRKFELPPRPAAPQADLTILQPLLNAKAFPPDLRLPQVLFWEPRPPERPKPKPLLLPGRREPVHTLPDLDAPPTLEIPNQEALSDVKIARVPSVKPPALVLPPPSSTTPIRLKTSASTENSSGTPEPSLGDPVNLIILSPHAPPLNQEITVPPGIQIAHLPGPPPGPATQGLEDKTTPGTRGQEKANAQGSAANAQVPANTSQAKGTSTSSNPSREPEGEAKAGLPQTSAASSPGPEGGAGGQKGETSQQARLSPLANAVGGPAAAPASSAAIGPPVLLSPRTIDFTQGASNVLIVQSSSGSVFVPGGILTGRPVYSVYLQLGTEKDWVLQYCIPHSSEAPRLQGNVLHLADPTLVESPYPVMTAVPEIARQARSTYLLIHALVSDSGQFKDLNLIGDHGEAVKNQVLSALQKWQFRPAFKNHKPVEVEVLIAIPPTR